MSAILLIKNKYSGASLQKTIVTPFNLHEKYEKYAPIIAFYAIFDYFYIKNMIFTKKIPITNDRDKSYLC